MVTKQQAITYFAGLGLAVGSLSLNAQTNPAGDLMNQDKKEIFVEQNSPLVDKYIKLQVLNEKFGKSDPSFLSLREEIKADQAELSNDQIITVQTEAVSQFQELSQAEKDRISNIISISAVESSSELYAQTVELEGKFLRAKYKQSQTNDQLEKQDLEAEKMDALAGIREIREQDVLSEGQFTKAELDAQKEYATWLQDYKAIQAEISAAAQEQVVVEEATYVQSWPEPGSDPLPQGTLTLENGQEIDFNDVDRKGNKIYADISYIHVPRGASVQLSNAPLDALTIIYPEGTVALGDPKNDRGEGDFTTEAYDEIGLKTLLPIARVKFDDAQKTIERSNKNTNDNTNRNTNQNVNATNAGKIIVDEGQKTARGQKTLGAAATDALFGVLREGAGALGNHNRNKNKNENQNTSEQTLPADFNDLQNSSARKGDLYVPPVVPKADIQAGKSFGSIDKNPEEINNVGSIQSNETQIALEDTETGKTFLEIEQAKRAALENSPSTGRTV